MNDFAPLSAQARLAGTALNASIRDASFGVAL
jgi:hypothetical protein